VCITCAGKGNFALRTFVACRFVELHEILSVEIEARLRMAAVVESLRYSREGTQRVTACAVGLLRRDMELLDKEIEERRGFE